MEQEMGMNSSDMGMDAETEEAEDHMDVNGEIWAPSKLYKF